MKILRIGGKNLASLAGDFEVDFQSEPLASSGLFAISGPTGAGKSTLLDALCLALYDATPRLIKGPRVGNYLPDVGDETLSVADRRTLIRRGTADAFAEVDFVGNDEQRYRARWSVRRSRNRAAGALQPSTMSLQQLPGLQPLGGTKTEVLAEIERRIGLSFEQFTRSVLLAQNEFSAFLRTDENERGELLETLTGSAVYSDISRRAYERWRVEQEAMRRLTTRLQDQAPLGPDARAELDTEHATAQAALTAAETRRTGLERLLRWHQELDRLRAAEVQADGALASARAEVDAAAARRRRLATLDAVQPARALVADLNRLAGEQRQVQAQLAAGEHELARALDAQQQAARGLMEAERKLEAAEDAQRGAAPQLDRAKALDATLDALAPAHAKARTALAGLRTESTQARAALQAKAAELEASRRTLQDTGAWLATHRARETLATQWTRWDQRLAQAEQAARLDASSAQALDTARAGAEQAAGMAQRTAHALAASIELLDVREAARGQATAALSGIDADALHAERRALDRRREHLGSLDHTCQALRTNGGRLADVEAQAVRATQARESAQESLEAARTAGIALDAAVTQAERMLKAAQLACADGVEKLRATLVDGEACPVCGGTEHPYRHQDDRLHAVLDNLSAELAARRAEQRANVDRQAGQRAAFDAAGERLAALARERDVLAAALTQLDAEWSDNPLAAEAPDGDGGLDARGRWLAAELAALRTSYEALETRDADLRRAVLARDAAQQAWDQANREHARLLEAAQTAQGTLARLDAEIAALTARREAAASALAELLAELDPVQAEACGDGWQGHWQRDPAGWRQARTDEARAWNDQAARQARLQGAIGTLEAEHTALAARVEHAGLRLAEADAEFARLDAELAARRAERAGLFEGRAVRDVEQLLAAAVAGARDALNACQAASLQAAQSEARVRAAQAQAAARITDLQGELADAGERLAQWIQDFDGSDPALESVANEQQLAALLQVGAAWIAQERTALHELDAAARQATAVLAERRAQREQHETLREDAMPPEVDAARPDMDTDTVAAPDTGAARDADADATDVAHTATQPSPPERTQASGREAPQAMPQDVATVAAALRRAETERDAARESVAGLAMRIREDEQRRERARAMMAEIERQRAVEERWAKLAELIGSADGKKFRNYAQQFTLDVLLGYANTHLAQLARRYRLERVVNAAAPSLALMVRDQDMGGEIRSVNSLSGGESFLVSLALALGLASLSSNRVKVESLFIDEGFGSLDSDTLGVAMDALDALQSLGRKVGVISHVQEMTERIATKVLVRPAGGGSSAVTVQC
jgi:exonuclease SbcC